jgi:hypothetical protein
VKTEAADHLNKARDCLGRARIILVAGVGEDAGRDAYLAGLHAAQAKGVKFGRKPKLTPHQQREAIKRRDVDGETLRSIGRSYNVSAQTISRLIA